MPIDERLIMSLEYSLGEFIMSNLKDPAVVEIISNSDGKIWVERQGEKMKTSERMDPEQARLVLNYVASALDTTVDVSKPIVEGELPIDGSRFEGAIPPIVSAPMFTIRKKAAKIFTLDDYAAKGIMPNELIPFLQHIIKSHKNILVVGGTGSGKTTLVNGLIRELSKLCPDDRLVIIEDTSELQSSSANTQFLRTSVDVNMTKLLAMTMRLRPDRILVGEVRDGAALDLLKAWNTGHPGGIATVHANSAAEGLTRLESLISEATSALQQTLIAQAVNFVLFIQRDDTKGRLITELVQVLGYDFKKMEYIVVDKYRDNDVKGGGQDVYVEDFNLVKKGGAVVSMAKNMDGTVE